MKNQPKPDTVSNDDIQTPEPLCAALVPHFKPRGIVVEPCRGDGNFYEALLAYQHTTAVGIDELYWYEVKEGRNFLTVPIGRDFDWIGPTNPPWSKVGDWYEIKWFSDMGPGLAGVWSDWVAEKTPEAQAFRNSTTQKQRDKMKRDKTLLRRKKTGFLEKSFQLAYNVVFLCTLNHLVGCKARYDVMDRYGFGMREIVLLDNPPKPWPQGGFQLGAVHFKHGYGGPVDMSDMRGSINYY